MDRVETRSAKQARTSLEGIAAGYGDSELARYDRLNADPVMAALTADTERTCHDLGFERFVAWVLWPARGPRRSTYVTNYSPDWMRRRLRNNYHSHDLVGARASQTGRTFMFREVLSRHMTEAQARVMEEARTFGLRTGGAMVRSDEAAGRICLCVSSVTSDNDFEKLLLDRQSALQRLMKTISQQFSAFQNTEATQSAGRPLTPHECEALMYAARGLTTQRTARVMGISDYTVKDHLKSAMQKLDAKSKTEAVAKAMIAGYVLP